MTRKRGVEWVGDGEARGVAADDFDLWCPVAY